MNDTPKRAQSLQPSFSLPTVINHRGVVRKVNFTLTETELQKLKNSSEVLHNAISQLKL